MAEPSRPHPPPPMALDWSGVYRRLDAARAALERGGVPTPEDSTRLLRARAQALAQEPERDEAPRQAVDIVEFLLAYETYGIEVTYVREVYPLNAFTPLPCTPPFVLGIVNIRGQLLSVVDLKTFFDLPAGGLTDLNKVIVVHNDTMALGVLADTIMGVRPLPLTSLQPMLPTLTGRRAAYLKGVTSERLVLLDAGKLLADHTLIVLEEVEDDAP